VLFEASADVDFEINSLDRLPDNSSKQATMAGDDVTVRVNENWI
jgi:hypothetical protein